MNSTIKICRKQGYVTNIFGRRIHLRGINDKKIPALLAPMIETAPAQQ